MRRILVASALFVTLSALMIRALHIESMDTAVSLQLALAAGLFGAAWFAHVIKERREP
jgi:hypothetical protein